jgi:flagellar protein FliS
MDTKYALGQYQTTAIGSGSPTKTVVCLYDTFIKLLYKAKKCIDDKDISGKCQSLQQASEVVLCLQNGLDLERGGSIAERLEKFYFRLFADVNMIIIKNQSHAEIDKLLEAVKPLRTTWQNISEQVTGTNASNSDAPLSANLKC